jgi:hypothetical protein
MCPHDACRTINARQRGLADAGMEKLGRPEWARRAQVCTHCSQLYSFEHGQLVHKREWP